MPQIPPLFGDQPWPTGIRLGPADRRLGDRRLRILDVTADRRVNSDRRRPVGRRETVGGHLRNALQMLEDLLSHGDADSHESRTVLLAAVDRLRRALYEADRLAADRSRLGHTIRLTELDPSANAGPSLRASLS